MGVYEVLKGIGELVKGTLYLAINEKSKEPRYLAIYEMSEKNYDTSPFTWYVKGTQYLAINEKRKGKRHLAFYDIPTRKAAEGSIL